MDDDEDVEPNNTLDGLLRKLEDGKAINELSAEAQAYICELRRTAKRRGGQAVGKLTIEIKIRAGSDGYMFPVVKLTTRPIPKPARPESTIYVDEDGDINGMPVPKQLSLSEVKKAKNTKDPAAPAAKGM